MTYHVKHTQRKLLACIQFLDMYRWCSYDGALYHRVVHIMGVASNSLSSRTSAHGIFASNCRHKKRCRLGYGCILPLLDA